MIELLIGLIALVGFLVVADVIFAPRVTKESSRRDIGEDNRRALMREWLFKGE